MSLVLKNQVEASEKSVDEIESKLRRDHQRALIAFDIRELMKSEVALFHDLNAGLSECQRSIEKDPTAEREWHALYPRLESLFARTAKLTKDAEGLAIDGKRAFFNAWRELRAVMSFPREEVALSIQQAKRGETIRLGEIKNALYGGTDGGRSA